MILKTSDVKFIESIGNDAHPVHPIDSSNCSFPARFGVGYSGTLGRRQTMEDCVVFKNYNGNDFLCGVFDGHGGRCSSASASLSSAATPFTPPASAIRA
jgi:hypothetical protein